MKSDAEPLGETPGAQQPSAAVHLDHRRAIEQRETEDMVRCLRTAHLVGLCIWPSFAGEPGIRRFLRPTGGHAAQSRVVSARARVATQHAAAVVAERALSPSASALRGSCALPHPLNSAKLSADCVSLGQNRAALRMVAVQVQATCHRHHRSREGPTEDQRSG